MHGLWVNGMDMSLLRRRLQSNYTTYQFSYNSVASTPAENAEKLQKFISSIEADSIHFVAHSLGGLVVRYLFDRYPDQKPGRIVTLGTPHRPSHSAFQLSKCMATKFLLGKSINDGLLGEVPDWPSSYELGSIAGTLRFGMGVVIPGLVLPNDGTVSVEETRLEGMSDHLTVACSHLGLLLSSTVFRAIDSFLQNGHFEATA